jgi:hypothetical protein
MATLPVFVDLTGYDSDGSSVSHLPKRARTDSGEDNAPARVYVDLTADQPEEPVPREMAVVIQACFRGFFARKKNKMAVKIQACFRGFLIRKKNDLEGSMPLASALLLHLVIAEQLFCSFGGKVTRSTATLSFRDVQNCPSDAKPNVPQERVALIRGLSTANLEKAYEHSNLYTDGNSTYLQPWHLAHFNSNVVFLSRWKATEFVQLMQHILDELVRNGTFSERTANVLAKRESYDRAWTEAYGDEQVVLARGFFHHHMGNIKQVIEVLRQTIRDGDGNLEGLSAERPAPFIHGLDAPHVYVAPLEIPTSTLVSDYGSPAVQLAFQRVIGDMSYTERCRQLRTMTSLPRDMRTERIGGEHGWTHHKARSRSPKGRNTQGRLLHYCVHPFVEHEYFQSEAARERFMYSVAAHLQSKQVHI